MNSQNETGIARILQAERDITRLINIYPHLLDSGKFSEVAGLLRYATLEVPGHQVTGCDEIETFLSSGIQRHRDGTPRTWHTVTNIVIEEIRSAVRLLRAAILLSIRPYLTSPCSRYAQGITKTVLRSLKVTGSLSIVPSYLT